MIEGTPGFLTSAQQCATYTLVFPCGNPIALVCSQFGATPAGWAIEYLREMGGFLGIELTDFAYAIRQGDIEWTKRFLTRFPGLRQASDTRGNRFKRLAEESGNAEILTMFESDANL